MRVQLIQVPYDSGHRGLRMGAGPEHLVANGIEDALRAEGHEVSADSVEASEGFRAEIKTAFDLQRQLAARVRLAAGSARFPLVLSGNCNSCLGTVAGTGAADLGILWFDGHGDFNTPDTTESGFLDGMGLATAAGLCWKKLASSIPGFQPVDGRNIVHIGSREFHPEERALFERAGGTIVAADAIRRGGMRAALETILDDLRSRVSRIYFHVDLDVLDPARSPANEFAVPDGLTLEQVEEAARAVAERFTIAAGTLASYDPRFDGEGEVLAAGMAIARAIVSAAGR